MTGKTSGGFHQVERKTGPGSVLLMERMTLRDDLEPPGPSQLQRMETSPGAPILVPPLDTGHREERSGPPQPSRAE